MRVKKKRMLLNWARYHTCTLQGNKWGCYYVTAKTSQIVVSELPQTVFGFERVILVQKSGVSITVSFTWYQNVFCLCVDNEEYQAFFGFLKKAYC